MKVNREIELKEIPVQVNKTIQKTLNVYKNTPSLINRRFWYRNVTRYSEEENALGQYSLQILNGVQLIEELAKKQDSSITPKEIESILRAMGERGKVSSVKAIWRENHT